MSNDWRPLAALAPPFGVAAVGLAVFQGDHELLSTPAVYMVLGAVGFIGWLVAWRAAVALSASPEVSIGKAQPGRVTITGKAQWPPGRRPLISTAGRPCVWFSHRERNTLHGAGLKSTDTAGSAKKIYAGYESTHPFIVDDGSGQCIVIPKGAEIRARNVDESTIHHETAIFAGDTVSISGLYRPFSPDSLPPEGNDDKLPGWVANSNRLELERRTAANQDTSAVGNVAASHGNATRTQTVTHTGKGAHAGSGLLGGFIKDAVQSGAGFKESAEARAAARQSNRGPDGDATGATPLQPPYPTLPTISQPGHGIYIITMGTLDGESSLYGLVKYLNAAILIASLAALAWLHFHPAPPADPTSLRQAEPLDIAQQPGAAYRHAPLA